MKISKKDLADTFDSNFIQVLKKVYITREAVNKTSLSESIHDLLSENNYSPSIPKFIIDYDKGKGVSRPVPVFNPIDYGVFYYCIKQLEENIALNRVEGTFGGWSLGGKIRHLESEEAGIEVVSMRLRGTVSWPGFHADGRSAFGFIFVVDTWTGEIPERNAEGPLVWQPIAKLADLPMWAGDRYFLPQTFDPEVDQFHLVIPYQDGQPLGWSGVVR